MSKTIVFLMAITLLGLGLRLYQLDQRTLFVDEFYSLDFSSLSLSEFINTRLTKGDVKPLYCMSLHLWRKYINDSEIGMRLYSVVFGILCILAIFLVANQLFGKRVGLMSAFILAISPLHIYYSQEIRMYVHQMFFILLSFYFFLRLLSEDKKRLWLGYVIVTLIGIYLHIFSALILIIQTIFLLTFLKNYRNLLKGWLLVQIFIALTVPSLIIFIIDCFGGHLGFWQDYLRFGTVMGQRRKALFELMLFPEVFSNFSLGFLLKEFETNLNILIPAFLFFVMVICLAILYLKNHPKEFTLLALFLLIPIILTIYVFSIQGAYMFHVRHVFIASAAYYILLAIGMMGIKRAQFRLFSISIWLFFSLLSLNDYYFKPQWAKIDWRAIGQFIERNAQPNDAILVDNSQTAWPLFTYYKCNFQAFKIMEGFPITEEDIERGLEDIAYRTRGCRRLWRVGLSYDDTPWTDFITLWLTDHSKRSRLDMQGFSNKRVWPSVVKLELYIL